MLHLVTVIYGRSDNNRLCMITTVDVLHQINNTTAVSILIVIPGHQLNKVVVEGNSGLGIEDAAVGA